MPIQLLHSRSLDECALLWQKFRRALAKLDARTEELATEPDQAASEPDPLTIEAELMAADPDLQVLGRALIERSNRTKPQSEG